MCLGTQKAFNEAKLTLGTVIMLRWALVLLISVPNASIALAFDLGPPDCPRGYTCTANDPLLNSLAQDRSEEKRMERERCEASSKEDEDMAVGEAAASDPGNPEAATTALQISRMYHHCD